MQGYSFVQFYAIKLAESVKHLLIKQFLAVGYVSLLTNLQKRLALLTLSYAHYKAIALFYIELVPKLNWRIQQKHTHQTPISNLNVSAKNKLRTRSWQRKCLTWMTCRLGRIKQISYWSELQPLALRKTSPRSEFLYLKLLGISGWCRCCGRSYSLLALYFRTVVLVEKWIDGFLK